MGAMRLRCSELNWIRTDDVLLCVNVDVDVVFWSNCYSIQRSEYVEVELKIHKKR